MTAPVDRRTFLRVGAATGATIVLSSTVGAAPSEATMSTTRKKRHRRRVYVLVIDGCRPGEIDSGLMPHVEALREAGRRYPTARSMPVMETIPNHVMMMTGVRPDRSHVPANAIYDRDEKVVRNMDRHGDLKFPTVISRLNRNGFTTGTVLSKEYLYGIFGKRATHRWEPFPVVPITEHSPDVFTMDAALAMVDEFDPNLVFVNLGDCDRFGHADLTGTTLKVARDAALVGVDAQIHRFTKMLHDTGRWKRSVVIVLADHSMDWSVPNQVISLAAAFEKDDLLAGKVQYAQNGGADLLYWTGRAARRTAAVAKMRHLAMATEGVLAVHDPAKLRLGPEAGDLVAYCKKGWRFSDPDLTSNPIPGNHGHPATRPIPFFITGGSPLVRTRTSSRRIAHTLDVAPTVGEVFGLKAPRGGYDGRSRL